MSHWTLRARRVTQVLAAAALILCPLLLTAQPVAAQTYQRVAARCLECGRSVPLNSGKGGTCPHCGVVWSVEQHEYRTSPGSTGASSSPAPARPRPTRSSWTAPAGSTPVITRQSCSGCGKSVSVRAQVGDTCPHCGGIWRFRNLEIEPEEDAGPLPLVPLSPVRVASSVAALRSRRPAVLGQLPPTLRRLDSRVEQVIQQLPPLAQEAYYVALEDYSRQGVRSQGEIYAAMRVLAQLPGRHWAALAEDVELALTTGALGSITQLRRNPSGTLRQVAEMAELLTSLE